MHKNKIHIDGIDKTILRQLSKDARSSIMGIARKVGISGAAIHQRLRKLESSGLIQGSQFNINPQVLGYHLTAYFNIATLSNVDIHTITKQLESIPEVIECHLLTGQFPILIKLIAKDQAHLLELQNTKINTIKGISKIQIQISLKQEFERQVKV